MRQRDEPDLALPASPSTEGDAETVLGRRAANAAVAEVLARAVRPNRPSMPGEAPADAAPNAALDPEEASTVEPPADVELAKPVFADVDLDEFDPTIAAALGDDDIARASRSLRNASLNGIAGSDLALGMLYWKLGRPDEAEGLLRNIARNDTTAANNLAAILETRGHLREAWPFYRRAATAGNPAAIENVARLEG